MPLRVENGNIVRRTGDTMSGNLRFTATLGTVVLPEYSTITAPREGMLGWDYAAHKLYIYSGDAWKLVTSAA